MRNEPFHSSLALRLRRICSSDESFTLRANELIKYLNDRGYNLSFLKKEIQRLFTQSHAMKHSNPVRLPQTNPVAFRLLSHAILSFALCQVSYKNTLKILSSSPRCNNILKTTPLVAFRRTDNLSDILVRSRQTDVIKGSFRCGKNCITCRYITDGRTNYTFSATGEISTIHDHIDCNSKNLIYMIHCLRCNKQYISETKR